MVTTDNVLKTAGTGRFQRRLLGIFGLAWTADAMQVLAVGFTVAAIAATFDLTLPEALRTGTLFFLGMLIGAGVFGRLADRFGRRRILLITVAMDAVFGLASAFAPDFTTLLVLRFLTGIAVGGTLPVDYAMMVGHCFQHVLKELPGRLPVGFVDELGHGELARPVDADEQVGQPSIPKKGSHQQTVGSNT